MLIVAGARPNSRASWSQRARAVPAPVLAAALLLLFSGAGWLPGEAPTVSADQYYSVFLGGRLRDATARVAALDALARAEDAGSFAWRQQLVSAATAASDACERARPVDPPSGDGWQEAARLLGQAMDDCRQSMALYAHSAETDQPQELAAANALREQAADLLERAAPFLH